MRDNMTDKDFLQKAITLSKKSVESGAYPVGAVLVLNNEIVSESISDGKKLNDATSHAEIACIREASKKLGKRDLKGAVIYSSMEPCLMCFSACYWAGVTKVVFACAKNKVSKMHYEGLHDLKEINQKNNRKIEIIQISELEGEALQIIKEWEKPL